MRNKNWTTCTTFKMSYDMKIPTARRNFAPAKNTKYGVMCLKRKYDKLGTNNITDYHDL